MIMTAGLIIGVTVLAVLVTGFNAMIRQLTESSQLIMDSYKNDMAEAIKRAHTFGENLAYSNESVQMMAVKTLPSVRYYEQEYKVRQSLKSYLSSDDSIYSFHIIDRFRDHIVSCYRTLDGSNYDLEQMLKKQFVNSPNTYAPVFIYEYQGEHYLTQTFLKEPINVLVLIRLSDYAFRDVDWLKSSGNAFVVFEEDGTLYENQELVSEYGLSEEKLNAGRGRWIFDDSFIYTEEIPGSGLKMHLVTTSKSIRDQMRLSAVSMLISFSIIILMMLFVYRQIRRLMIYPVKNIGQRIDSLSRGEIREFDVSDVSEFRLIDNSITELMTVMSELKNKYYEEQMKHQELMLQYYQLQTEPHFFLNCLKNITSMAEDGQYDRISRLSVAFSEHIRYIFRKGTDTVSLDEEVNEATSYFRICSLRSSQPMLFEKDVDESLNSFRVPPLSIQTFIENTMKYGWIPGNLLRIQLTVRQITKEDGNYISIRIEDNGPGYRPEILDELNRIGEGEKDGIVSQKVGIYNLIKRTRLLYGDQAEFAFFNGTEGHAVSVLILPERNEEAQDETSGS